MNAVAFSADARTLTTCGADQTIRQWERATGKETRRFTIASEQQTVLVRTPDGRGAASAGYDGKIRLWDLESGKELRAFGKLASGVLSLAFSPDGKVLASGGDDHLVRLWNVNAGEELDVLKGHENGVTTLLFSPDGRTLASAATDEAIYLWDVATGKEMRHVGENGADVERLAFSPEGKVLAAGSRDGAVRLWDVASGQILRLFEGNPGYVLSLAYSADGKTLAVGSWLTARLWEVATGKERGRFDSQQGDVTALAFSPDGETLAAGSGGTTVLLWDVTSRQHDNGLETVNLSPQELEALWADLHSQDASRAYRAVWTLAAGARQSIPFLQTHLKPAPLLGETERKKIASLIANLESDNFETREKADAELEKLAEIGEPVLRKALEGQPTPEIRDRLERILQRLQEPAKVRERIRLVRANEVLEKIGSPESRQVLKSLAEGAPDCTLTQDARAALDRLAKRLGTAP